MKLIGGFIDTYLRLDPDELLLFEREADRVLNTNERSRMLEITTSWEGKGLPRGRREGREEGHPQGRQEGLAEGRRDECLRLPVRQLQRRLGPQDTTIQAGLDVLSTERLEALAEALLDFTSIAEVRAWLLNDRKTA